MRWLKYFENFNNSVVQEELENIMDYFDELKDYISPDEYKIYKIEKSITPNDNFLILIYCDFDFNYLVEKKLKEQILPRINRSGYKIISTYNFKSGEKVFKNILNPETNRTTIVGKPEYVWQILISGKGFIKENLREKKENIIIVDVQKSFSKYFTQMYVNQLQKHCQNFQNVYLIWDNHHLGRNVDKDYLYEDEPEIPISDEFYDFPNLKEIIQKRYNYDVDVNFYKKILDEDVYHKILELEEKNQLKKGDFFKTNQETIIVYIGNNHKWFHCGKKLYQLLNSLKGKEVEIVGGSSEECLLDIVTCAESLGVKIKTNFKFVWSPSHCSIK